MRSYYDNLCQNAKSLVDGETSASLLEQILGLFIRVWSHSHARDVKEQHKAKINEIKMHALRAELKKSSKQEANFNVTLIGEHGDICRSSFITYPSIAVPLFSSNKY